MKLVVDEKGNAVLQNGMPVYEYPDGTKAPFDAEGTLTGLQNKITAESEKATRFYQDREALVTKLKPFDGLNPDDVSEAMKLKKNLSDKQLLDANGVEELKRQMRVGFEDEKAAITKSFEGKIADIENSKSDLHQIIYDLAVKNQFATSEYFAGDKPKTILRPGHAARIFADHFKLEVNGRDYRMVALDDKGKPLMSRKNHGELADFNEAIALIVEAEDKVNPIMSGSSGRGPRNSGNLRDEGVDPNSLSNTDLIRRGLEKRRGLR